MRTCRASDHRARAWNGFRCCGACAEHLWASFTAKQCCLYHKYANPPLLEPGVRALKSTLALLATMPSDPTTLSLVAAEEELATLAWTTPSSTGGEGVTIASLNVYVQAPGLPEQAIVITDTGACVCLNRAILASDRSSSKHYFRCGGTDKRH